VFPGPQSGGGDAFRRELTSGLVQFMLHCHVSDDVAPRRQLFPAHRAAGGVRRNKRRRFNI
jgi:hypothetical protein